jgi:hypothetical protein
MNIERRCPKCRGVGFQKFFDGNNTTFLNPCTGKWVTSYHFELTDCDYCGGFGWKERIY